MQLKIIIVPALIILSLVLGIGFIKPDYDTLMQKRTALKAKQDQVAKIDATQANMSALNQALDTKSDLEAFVLRYYPEAMDQERTIDSFNFMAAQSGLVIDSMEMKEVIAQKQEEPLGVGGPLTSVPGEVPESPEGEVSLAPVYQAPTPGSFVAQVKAKGSYDNIKNFLNRLSRMDRMNSISTLSIDVDTTGQKEGEGEVASSDQLVGTFQARFDYVKNKEGQNALGVPVFDQSTLATQKLEEAVAWASSPVPVLNVDQSGRANPFQ